jgi:hypothetical protein
MLEWGYIPHKGDGITDNLITIGDAYTLYAEKRIAEVFKLAEEHRKITKGTSEIQVAVVNNYEYTLNAAGSFEFTVDFTGNSTLFKNLQSGAVGSGFIPELGFKPVERKEGEELSEKLGQTIPIFADAENIYEAAATDIQVDLNKFNYGPGFGSPAVTGKVQDKATWIKGAEEKFRAATPNDFFRNLKTYIQECYKIGAGAGTIDVNPWAAPVPEEISRTRSLIHSHESRLKSDGIFYEQVPGAINQAGQKFDYGPFNNEIGPYVTWGWFEDNILNVVYGKNRDKSHPLKWESIDQTGIPIPLNSHKFLYTTTPDKLIIPGRMPDMLENKWDSEEGDLQKGVYAERKIATTKEGVPLHEGTPIPDAGKLGEHIANKFLRKIGRGEYVEGYDADLTDADRIAAAQTEVLDPGLKVESIFGAYHPIVHDYIRISENALGFDSPIPPPAILSLQESDAVGGGFLTNLTGLDANELEDLGAYANPNDEVLYDKRETLIRTASDLRGSIRRLVLHYSLIQDSFIGAATPVEGLRILLNKIENMGYKGFWDFDIFEVDDTIGVYEKNSLSPIADYAIEKVKEQINAGKLDSKQQDETPPPGEVFVFPTWNKDGGFVINQNLTVKLPTGKMLAMVYGNSLQGKKALQNKAFGNSHEAQIFSNISAGEESPPQKINVDPGFQGSKIDVITSIGLSGIKSYGHMSLVNTSTKIKSEIKAKEAAIEYSYIGAKSIPIDGDGAEGNIFSRGISIDAHGIMYENVKQVMNYRLQKDYMKEGGIYIKITDRTTRVLDMAELSIKIQGLSGLNWGNQFHTDYIEQRFKDEVVFFITKVNHEITEMNWTTEIVGGMRATFKDDYIKEAVTLDTLENRHIDIKLSAADNKLINKMRKTTHKSILINSGRMNRIVKQPEGSIN